MKYYTVLALLPCIPFSWALSLFLLDHGALILGVGKVAKIVALPCLWAYLVLTLSSVLARHPSLEPISPAARCLFVHAEFVESTPTLLGREMS